MERCLAINFPDCAGRWGGSVAYSNQIKYGALRSPANVRMLGVCTVCLFARIYWESWFSRDPRNWVNAREANQKRAGPARCVSAAAGSAGP